jgi:hypothetical protein
MVRLRGERAGPDGGISSHGPRAEELCSTARAVSKPTNCPPASVSVFKWAGYDPPRHPQRPGHFRPDRYHLFGLRPISSTAC